MTHKNAVVPLLRPQAPARREYNAVSVSPERVNPGGPISSTLMRWTAERHTRTLTAVAARTRAEGDLFNAQSTEEAHLDYLHFPRIILRERIDCIVQGHQIRVVFVAGGFRVA